MENPLTTWLSGKQSLPNAILTGKIASSPETWNTFLSIDEKEELFRANDLDWKSLEEASNETKTYIQEASKVVFGGTLRDPDHEDRYEIREKLGDPPKQVTPIYLIATECGGLEKIVYIGKTTTETRFSNGHLAALKLHDPKYDNCKKFIYRCSLWFLADDEYVSIEWLTDLSFSKAVIDSVESQLIHRLSPVLNSQKVNQNLSQWNFEIVVDAPVDRMILGLRNRLL